MLRFVRPESVTDTAVLDHYRSLLMPDELARLARFRFEHDRHTRLVAWASLRLNLSEACGGAVGPRDWRFQTNEYGKPSVDFPDLRFNISHTRGMIAVLVSTDGREVGVDVEAVDRHLDEPLSLAERFFAPAEVADLQTSAGEQVVERFFEYWTLKESYIKARGMGLAIPLDQFWFSLRKGAAPRIHFAPGFDDDPGRWEFRQERVGDSHLAALCVSS